MNCCQNFEKKLDELTKSLQDCSESLKVLQLLVLSQVVQYPSLSTQQVEYIHGMLNTTFDEYEEIKKILSPSS